MEVIENFKVYPHILAHDFLRYFVAAGLAYFIFWVLGKRAWQHRFIQSNFPQGRKLWREFRYSLSTVVIFSMVGSGIYLSEKAGYTKFYADIGGMGWIYFLMSLLIMILFHDLYFYWTHRLLHHPRIYKYVHRVHHLSTNPSPWAAYSFHPWEALVQAAVLPIIVFTIPVHPLAVFLFLVYMIIRNVLGHLGFELFPAGFSRNKWWSWHTTSVHHNLHHQHFNSNYGLYFSWWDNLMGTTHKQYHQKFDEVQGRKKNRDAKRVASITILVLLVPLFSLAQSLLGTWRTYNEETGEPLSHIRIDSTTQGIEGRVVKIILAPYQGKDPICVKCPPDKQNRKVIGMTFLWDFEQVGDKWVNGKILDPQNGEVYNSKMWLEDPQTLKVRGFGGPWDLFFRTQTWVRAENQMASLSPSGLWKTIDDKSGMAKSLVEISDGQDSLYGTIKKIFLLPQEGEDPICLNCPGQLKGQKIIGMKILWGFNKLNGKWAEGKIMDPGNGKTYSCTMWMLSDKELKVRGHLGPFYRTQTWRKVDLAKFQGLDAKLPTEESEGPPFRPYVETRARASGDDRK